MNKKPSGKKNLLEILTSYLIIRTLKTKGKYALHLTGLILTGENSFGENHPGAFFKKSAIPVY